MCPAFHVLNRYASRFDLSFCSAATVAATFDQAPADFEAAWRVFLSSRTEADFQEWRRHRDWTAEKYRRFDRGERMPYDWRPSD
jgi:hypothetical protein